MSGALYLSVRPEKPVGITELASLLNQLAGAVRAVAGADEPLHFRSLRMQSPFIAVIVSPTEQGGEALRHVVSAMDAAESGAGPAPGDRAITQILAAAREITRLGRARVRIDGRTRTLTAKAVETLSRAEASYFVEVGDVEGRIVEASLEGRATVIVAPLVGMNRLRCLVTPEQCQQLAARLDEFVWLEGQIKYKVFEAEPVEMLVERYEFAARRSEQEPTTLLALIADMDPTRARLDED